jgi:hypothetical protein
LGPVGLLQQLGVGEADLLGAGGAGESVKSSFSDMARRNGYQ